MDIKNVPVIENAYYVTTRNELRTMDDWVFWRTDKLLRLLVANDFMYTSKHGMSCMIDGEVQLDDVWRFMTVETFQQEYLSGFDAAEFDKDYFNKTCFPPNVLKEVFNQMKLQK